MEMRIGRQREVDRKGRESEHKQENEKRLKSIQRFFFLILGFEAFAASDASSDREEQREPKARLSPSYGLPCVAQVAFFHRGRDYADVHCPRLYEVKRRWERERGFFDAVCPSLPRPTHSLRLRFLPPLINHLCVWVCLKL